MIINLTDEQVQRYTEALERALDCPFIQADDELYDDLLTVSYTHLTLPTNLSV